MWKTLSIRQSGVYMNTSHKVLFQDSKCLKEVPTNSVNLNVTFQPYPMVTMRDTAINDQNVNLE